MALSDDVRTFASAFARWRDDGVELKPEAVAKFCELFECFATGVEELERELATLRRLYNAQRRRALDVIAGGKRC